MRRGGGRRLAVTLLCAALPGLGCPEAAAPGRFTLDLTWGAAPVPTAEDYPELQIQAHVEQRPGGVREQARQLAAAGPVPYLFDGATEIALDGVPNAADLVVVVELLLSPTEPHPVAFGESAPFVLEPDVALALTVEVSLTYTPRLALSAGGRHDPALLEILEATGPDRDQVNTPVVTLAVHARHATAIEVAADVAFSGAVETRALDALDRDDEGRVLWVGWDLNADAAAPAPDGVRAVFLRLQGPAGYTSETVGREVTLDRQPPTGAALSSPVLRIVELGLDNGFAPLTFAAIGADELWIEGCEGDCSAADHALPAAMRTCEQAALEAWLLARGRTAGPGDTCLPTVNDWQPFRTTGWFLVDQSRVRHFRVRYRDHAHNETGWAVLEFEAVEFGEPWTWVPIPAGSFVMGGIQDGDGWNADIEPAHPVDLPAFELTATEITQWQYETVTGERPSVHRPEYGGYLPVENVGFFAAQEFCAAIGGRLPSEAEWEYAARAGGDTLYLCGDTPECLTAYAWDIANSMNQTMGVGFLEPNAWGLYDVFGNVAEWVEDCEHGDYQGAPADGSAWILGGLCGRRGVRGGSVDAPVSDLRVVTRRHQYTNVRSAHTGLRCARDPS